MTGNLSKKWLAVSLAFLMGNVNGVFVYSGESNFWVERRKDVWRSRGEGVLLASLPSLRSSNSLLQNVQAGPPSPVQSSLPPHVKRNIPADFLQRHHALFSSLSRDYGTIRKISLGSSFSESGPVVVHIQDVHKNPDAQRNIGAAVQHALGGSRVGVLALEGCGGEIDFRPFRKFSNRKAVQLAADFLLKENKISGPIHGVLTGTGPLPAVLGVDDSVHYNANVEAYRQSAPRVEALRKEFRARLARMEKRKEDVYSPALREFDREVERYHHGRTSLGDYAVALVSQVGILRDHSSIRDFTQALALERALDFRQVETERARVIQRLIERVSSDEEAGLLSQAVAYRAGKVSYADFYSQLRTLCERAGVSLASFPALDGYVRYVLLADKIDAEVLSQDLQSLEDDLYQSLAGSPEERRLAEESRRILLTQKLVEFSLTPEEWKTYLSLIPSSDRTEGMKDQVERREGGLGLSDLRPFERFYQEAQARDSLMADRLLHAMKRDAGVALLVAGGFHAGGVTQHLIDAGVTVVSFVPRIEKADVHRGAAYLSVFTQEKTPLEQLFQGEKLFLASHPAPPSLVRGLLPALVVLVALWGGGLWAGMDPQVLYLSLGGVGVLSGIKLLKENAEAILKMPSGKIGIFVQMGRGQIASVREGWVAGKGGVLSLTDGAKETINRIVLGAGRLRSHSLLADFAFAPRRTQLFLMLIPLLVVGVGIYGGLLLPESGLSRTLDASNLSALFFLAVGTPTHKKKMDGLYAALSQLIVLSEEISEHPHARLDPSNAEDVATAVKFKGLLEEVMVRASAISPEFKSMADELDTDVDIGKLLDLLSRTIFIPAGRCLPRDWKKNKSPLVIEPGSWKSVEYLGQRIRIANVFPWGRVKKNSETPGILGLKGFVFLDNSFLLEKTSLMWKTISQGANRSSRGIFLDRAVQARVTERDLDFGMMGWSTRLELAKSKDAIYAAQAKDVGISEITLADELSEVLLPGGPAGRAAAESGSAYDRGIYKSYAEYLAAFYEHLVALSDLGPEKAHVIGVLALAEIMEDSFGDHPRQKGARFLVDQILDRSQALVGDAGGSDRESLVQFFVGDISTFNGFFRLVEEIRNENLVRPEDRFYRLFERAPNEGELSQLYTRPLSIHSEAGKTVPLARPPERPRRSLAHLLSVLAKRANAFSPSADSRRYGAEVQSLLQAFVNLQETYSSTKTTRQFSEFLRALSGDKGFRARSLKMRNIKEVELNAVLMEDLLLEAAKTVFHQEVLAAQAMIAGGDVEGGIRSLLNLGAEEPLMNALPPPVQETLNEYVESARVLFVLGQNQKRQDVAEILEKSDLFGLDEVEIGVLRALSLNEGQPGGAVMGENGLNSWGLRLLFHRLGKHAPDDFRKIIDAKEKEEERAKSESPSPEPLVLYGGYSPFVSDDVVKSELWRNHRKEILEKLNRFLHECVDDQVQGNKEKIDVSIGGLLLGRDLWGIHRGYLPAARFYFRVFDETGPEGENRKGVYVIAVENKGDSSEKGGRGKINEGLKAHLQKWSKASSSGNREFFGNFKPLFPVQKKQKNGRDRGVPLTDRMAMHPVGGPPLNPFQGDFLKRRARGLAAQELRASWANQIVQALEDPAKKRLMSVLGLIDPVDRLISLLRMEDPTVRINGMVLPVQIKIISGTPDDLFPGMPQAYGEAVRGHGRTPARLTLGVFPDDLAGVIHEGVEILLRTGLFGNLFRGKAHTYAFLAEILANHPSDGLGVSKRAFRELEKKNWGELLEFLNKGRQSLQEINARFSDPVEHSVRDRLLDTASRLTEFALAMLRERMKDPMDLFFQRMGDLEKWLAMGSMEDVKVEVEGLERALTHLERKRGAHPILARYVEGMKERLASNQSGGSEPQFDLAQRYSGHLRKLELLLRTREWVSLWQNINKLRISRASRGLESAVQEQRILFDLWDKIGLSLTPVLKEGDWAEADRQVRTLEAFGVEVIKIHGIKNQYFESLLFDYVGIYRAQRDLAHRNRSETNRMMNSMKSLHDISMGPGPMAMEERVQLNRVLFGMPPPLNEWEISLVANNLSLLSIRLTSPLLFVLQGKGALMGSNSHTPFLQRILMKNPSLRVSPKEISDVFSLYLSNGIPLTQAIARLVEWGITRSEAELLFSDLNTLNTGLYNSVGSLAKMERGKTAVGFISGIAGLFALGGLIPLIMGKGSVTLILASVGTSPLYGAVLLFLAVVFGLGFVGLVWRSVDRLILKGISSGDEKLTAKNLVLLLQGRPISLGIDGESLINSGSRYGEDRPFLSIMRKELGDAGISLSFAEARRRLGLVLGVESINNLGPNPMPFGGGDKTLTISYLDGASVPKDGILLPVIRKHLVGNGAEIIVVPVDDTARKAADNLEGISGVRVVNQSPQEGEKDSGGPWYRLDRVERRLAELGVDFSSYTGCQVVAPLEMDIGGEGVKSALFREALVILLSSLNPIVVRRKDLIKIDRLARAISSAA